MTTLSIIQVLVPSSIALSPGVVHFEIVNGPPADAASYTREFTDTENFADAATTVFAASPAFTDPTGLTETRAVNLSVVLTDTVGLVDVAGKAVTTAAVTDSTGITDPVLTKVAITSRALSDLTGNTDAVTTNLTTVSGTSFTQLAADDSGMSDAAQSLSAFVRTAATDIAGLADPSVVTSTLYARTLPVDNAGLADSAAVVSGVATAFTDAAGAVDTRVFDIAPVATDPTGLVDVTSRTYDAIVVASDITGITDPSVTRALGAGVQLDLADPTGITDPTVATAAAISPNFTDAAVLTDATTTIQNFVLALSDATGSTDSAASSAAVVQAVVDVTGATDATASAAGFAQAFADDAGLSDPAATRAFAVSPVITDLVGSADPAAPTFGVNRVLIDPVGVTDTSATAVAISFVPVVTDVTGSTDPAVAFAQAIDRVRLDLNALADTAAPVVLKATLADPVGNTDATATSQAFAIAVTDVTGITDPTVSAVSSTPPTGFRAKLLTYSPVIYLGLDETSGTTANDVSGNARNGTYSGTYTQNVTDTLLTSTGSQFVTTPSVGKVAVPHAAPLNIGTTASERWTVMYMHRQDGTTPTFMTLIGKGSEQSTVVGSKGYAIWHSGSGTNAAYKNNNLQYGPSTLTLQVGVWHWYTWTFDGSLIRCYVDGVLTYTSGAVTAGTVDNTAAFNLGTSAVGGNSMNGTLDEVAIVPSCLTQANITELQGFLTSAQAYTQSATDTRGLTDAITTSLVTGGGSGAPFSTAGTSIATTSWVSVWSDEFTSDTTNGNKWNRLINLLPNGRGTTSQVAVSGGILSLWSTASSSTDNNALIGYVSSSPGDGATAGHLFAVGEYLEGRVFTKGPTTSKGYNWDAIWADSSGGLEFDLMEMLGSNGARDAHVVFHPDFNSTTSNVIIGGTWFNAWHVIGVDRRDVNTSYVYYDGVQVATINTSAAANKSQTQSILLNSGQGSNLGQAGSFDVDWVRVWRVGP